MSDGTPIPFPSWATRRDFPWVYVGWIENPPGTGDSFDEVISGQLKSDHGEIREVDRYPEGATCWCREETRPPRGER